jgi:hypothetical protein
MRIKCHISNHIDEYQIYATKQSPSQLSVLPSNWIPVNSNERSLYSLLNFKNKIPWNIHSGYLVNLLATAQETHPSLLKRTKQRKT